MYCRTIAMCIIVFLCTGFTAAQTVKDGDSGLTFMERTYVRLSNLCRALADMSGMPDEVDDISKAMKILFVKDGVIKSFPINESYSSLTQPGMFDITKQTKMIVHGFRANGNSSFAIDLANAYDSKKLFNVLVVDAEELLSKTYLNCVRNSRLIGKRLANLLANLENFGANAEDFHILGISLGAHIAGWAGKYFRVYRQRRLGHVTGLDPAGPCFTYALSQQRLDRTDAAYVDVLHTNRMVQGVLEPLGHADFYLNGGGPNQPGCFMPKCSHLRAAEVYVESINKPKSFIGVQCSSWKHFQSDACAESYAVMGYGSPATTRGQFHLRTAAGAPFGLGLAGTRAQRAQRANTVDSWIRTRYRRNANKIK